MATAPADLLFPYMFWARAEAWGTPWCLTQSGMPAPDPALFLRAGLPDLGPPGAEALPALEARLAQLFGTDPARVIVTPGASGAMLLSALGFFPGARVVTEVPSYEPFRALPARFAADTRVVTRRAADGFRLPLEEVAGALAGARPGHVFLSTPHNPTGNVLDDDELREVARLAERAGGILVSNEVYMEFARPAERRHAFALAPNALSIGNLTKAYGLGALRIGWIVLGEALAERRRELLDLSYLGWVDPPTAALRAALSALDSLETLLRPLRAFEAESRPLLERWLAESEVVEGFLGPLGLSAFPRVLGVGDTHALRRHLVDTEQVNVVPGEFFGLPGHVRVGYAVPPATLSEALERLERGIRSFPGRR